MFTTNVKILYIRFTDMKYIAPALETIPDLYQIGGVEGYENEVVIAVTMQTDVEELKTSLLTKDGVELVELGQSKGLNDYRKLYCIECNRTYVHVCRKCLATICEEHTKLNDDQEKVCPACFSNPLPANMVSINNGH